MEKMKKKIVAYVDEEIHRKTKGHAGFLGIDIQDMVGLALKRYIIDIENERVNPEIDIITEIDK